MAVAPRHPCATHGCPRLVERGHARCEEHEQQHAAQQAQRQQQPWQHSKQGQGQQQRRRGGSGWQWKRTRERVLKRDNYQCQWCGGPATEADHVIAVADGGTDSDENLVAACQSCNQRRNPRNSNRRGG